jgi:hypothetical protein
LAVPVDVSELIAAYYERLTDERLEGFIRISAVVKLIVEVPDLTILPLYVLQKFAAPNNMTVTSQWPSHPKYFL